VWTMPRSAEGVRFSVLCGGGGGGTRVEHVWH